MIIALKIKKKELLQTPCLAPLYSSYTYKYRYMYIHIGIRICICNLYKPPWSRTHQDSSLSAVQHCLWETVKRDDDAMVVWIQLKMAKPVKNWHIRRQHSVLNWFHVHILKSVEHIFESYSVTDTVLRTGRSISFPAFEEGFLFSLKTLFMLFLKKN